MSRVKVGFPDGDGVLGGYEFWKKYCDTAEVELVDVTHKLSELQVISQSMYLQPIITQYFIDNKSEIWLLFLIAHSKR